MINQHYLLQFVVMIKTNTIDKPYYFILEMSGKSLPEYKDIGGLKDFINNNTPFICDEIIGLAHNGVVYWSSDTKDIEEIKDNNMDYCML